MRGSLKGIILIGGSGSRLQPVTYFVNKHFLPVGGRPMFFFPLTNLLLAGCSHITFVGDAYDLSRVDEYFSVNPLVGIQLDYRSQDSPAGIVDGLLIGGEPSFGESVWLALGDNIFSAEGLSHTLQSSCTDNAHIYSVKRKNWEAFGVLQYRGKKPVSVIEKPESFVSDDSVIGLYRFPSDWFEKAEQVKKSVRGELEITTLINHYFAEDRVQVHSFGRCATWVDAGTFEGLYNANTVTRLVELSGFELGDPWIAADAFARFNEES